VHYVCDGLSRCRRPCLSLPVVCRYAGANPPSLRYIPPNANASAWSERWKNFVRAKTSRQVDPVSFEELGEMWGNMTEAEKDTYAVARDRSATWEVDEVVMPKDLTPAGMGSASCPITIDEIEHLPHRVTLSTSAISKQKN